MKFPSYNFFKFVTMLAVIMLLAASPISFAQSTPPLANVFSEWVSLSLRGNSQNEIESKLRHLGEGNLKEVKQRLRQTVISNLRLRKIRELYLGSRDSDDLNNVMSFIATEIRFAGLQNDEQIVLMIKDNFGIPLAGF